MFYYHTNQYNINPIPPNPIMLNITMERVIPMIIDRTTKIGLNGVFDPVSMANTCKNTIKPISMINTA